MMMNTADDELKWTATQIAAVHFMLYQEQIINYTKNLRIILHI